MKDIINTHFDKIAEIVVLVFIFVFATVMLAYFKNEEMARWIENGAIIAILARTFGARPNATPIVPDSLNTTTVVQSTTQLADKPQ